MPDPASGLDSLPPFVGKRQEMTMSLCIVMSTYNGARFLHEQLDSICRQTLRPSEIVVRDDGSTDSTVAMLRGHTFPTPTRLTVVEDAEGRVGPARSFWLALRAAGAGHDFYAFSDQDDIWLERKLETATEWLRQRASDPTRDVLAFSSRVIIADEHGKRLGLSPPCTDASAARILFHICATGNTMVITPRLRDVILTAPVPKAVPIDHLVQLLAAANRGLLFCDQPGLLYRQHAANASGGMRAGFVADQIRRLTWFWRRGGSWYESRALAEFVMRNLAQHVPDSDDRLLFHGFARCTQSTIGRLRYALLGRVVSESRWREAAIRVLVALNLLR